MSLYNFKCIKDYWMEGDTESEGDTPAFVEGIIYTFHRERGMLQTDKDNHGYEHLMDYEEMYNCEYFEEVL